MADSSYRGRSISTLSLVQELARDLTRHEKLVLVRTPGVCGGDPCVAGTRIAVWMIELLRRRGATREQILQVYPTICEQDVVIAFEYADRHRVSIDAQIDKQDDDTRYQIR
jgi:uncharacterized protein (DUF433 family)